MSRVWCSSATLASLRYFILSEGMVVCLIRVQKAQHPQVIGTPPSRQLVHVIFHAQPGWKCPRARAHNRHAHSLFAFCCCCWQATLVMVRAASLLRQCAGGRAASCCLTRSRRRTPMCSASCCRSWRMAGSLTARWVWGPGRAGTSGSATHAVCVIFPPIPGNGPSLVQLRKKSADHRGWQAY